MAQGHPDSWHRVTREGPVEPAALARWLERRSSSLRHPACTVSEDSGAADENIDGARKFNNNLKKSRDNDNIFFLEGDFFHLNRILKISSYFFLMIIMCTHNGNTLQ